MSGELWLAEGFTSYYGVLAMVRAGIVSQDQGASQLAMFAAGVLRAPGTQFRSAVDMSRLAPYVDAAQAVDPTNWENTFVSYYTYGAAIAPRPRPDAARAQRRHASRWTTTCGSCGRRTVRLAGRHRGTSPAPTR